MELTLSTMSNYSISKILESAKLDLLPYEALYKDLHTHPELSNLENETARKVAEQLAKLDVFQIFTNIGGYGLAAVFENSPGNVVLLRSDLDALPIQENTGLPYASKVRMRDSSGEEQPVMHACGHDIHMTCLIAAAEILKKTRAEWSGTVIVLFQPAEERGTGARAMVDDGLYDKIPLPNFILGQHVMAMRSGSVGIRSGTIMAGADSMKVTLYGRGGHGSQPQSTCDPTVMASNTVVRLQNIVSREIKPGHVAVVTVGSLQSGNTENIIPDSAQLGIDMRSVENDTRQHILSAIKRIADAESDASQAPKTPFIEQTRSLPVTDNNGPMVQKLSRQFANFFKDDFDPNTPITTIAEDFSILGTSRGIPYAFWHFGGIDEVLWDKMEKAGKIKDIPMNHSSGFAPVIQPTLQTGINALCVAALTFLGRGQEHKL